MVKLLGPLFFLIHITDLAEGISSTAKLFADDTSIFSVDNEWHQCICWPNKQVFRKDINVGLSVEDCLLKEK